MEDRTGSEPMEADGPAAEADSSEPSTSASQSAIVSYVACGSSHSLALLSSDIALSWGRGEDGQLGHGDAEERKEPEAIHALLGAGVTSVHSGAEYSLACCRNRREVYSWGWGDFGRLGHGDAQDVFIPRSIPGLSGKPVRDVACGDTHTLVSTFDGELWGFGRNQNGQLGLGHTDDAYSPHCVEDLKGQQIRSVSCGSEHSIVATEEGKVYAWGWGRYGNVGDGTREDSSRRHRPARVQGLDHARGTQVACGWRHTIVVDSDGCMYSFGWNKYGQLGHGTTEDEVVPRKIEALSKRHILRIAGGWRHTIAGDDKGQLWSFGWNKFGQLGLGKHDNAPLPEPIMGLASHHMTHLACGWRHSIAVSSQGQVFAWGRAGNGQLGIGDGKIPDQFSPQRVDCLSAGTMKLERFKQPAAPTTTYVAPADRYAVVPNQRPPTPNGCLAVPQVVPTCRTSQDSDSLQQQGPSQMQTDDQPELRSHQIM